MTRRVERAPLPRAEHAVLAARLTARDRWILRMLTEHRVLTTDHLRALAFAGSLRYTQTRLRQLAQLGVIASFRRHSATGSVPLHWVLEHPGRVVLAAEDAHPAPARDARQVGRGLALAHNRQLAHQLGINTCLTHLATTRAGEDHRGDGRGRAGATGWLELWWGQARCSRHFRTARPDAYAVWATLRPAEPGAGGDRPGRVGRVAFFVEYDTGSETLAQLSAKLVGYHHLAATTAITTPLLIWLPTPGREHSARAALAHALAALPQPHWVPLATAHPPLGGRPEDPWQPHHRTWSPLHPPGTDPQPGRAGTEEPSTRRPRDQWPTPAQPVGPPARVSLTTLTTTWPPPRHTHHGRLHELAATAPLGDRPDPAGSEIAAPPPTPPAITPIRRPRPT